MHRRQPPPRLWLMTDERQGERLWAALERLPRGSGVIFRHYSLPQAERARLFGRVRRVARRRNLLLYLAGSPRLARAWGAHGTHGTAAGPTMGRTASAHSLREVRTAERRGANAIFLSPVYPTRSHPGAPVLGRLRFGLVARSSRVPVIALGGLNARRARSLVQLGAAGWAAIDAWTKAAHPYE